VKIKTTDPIATKNALAETLVLEPQGSNLVAASTSVCTRVEDITGGIVPPTEYVPLVIEPFYQFSKKNTTPASTFNNAWTGFLTDYQTGKFGYAGWGNLPGGYNQTYCHATTIGINARYYTSVSLRFITQSTVGGTAVVDVGVYLSKLNPTTGLLKIQGQLVFTKRITSVQNQIVTLDLSAYIPLYPTMFITLSPTGLPPVAPTNYWQRDVLRQYVQAGPNMYYG
jgi:hypothetical protein